MKVKPLISKEESSLNLIGFSMAERFSSIQKGDCLSVVGELTLNEWQNHITPQIQLKDIGIEGTEWIDYRSSHIGTHFFQQENALYVFQNKQLAQHYENQLASNLIPQKQKISQKKGVHKIQLFYHLIVDSFSQ